MNYAPYIETSISAALSAAIDFLELYYLFHIEENRETIWSQHEPAV